MNLLILRRNVFCEPKERPGAQAATIRLAFQGFDQANQLGVKGGDHILLEEGLVAGLEVGIGAMEGVPRQLCL